MLIIRQEQLNALADAMRRFFCRELVIELRPDLPDDFPPDTLPDLVVAAVDAAARYGLHEYDHLRRFVLIALRHGAEWEDDDATRWMHERMIDRRVTAAQDRLARVEQELLHRARVGAANDRAAGRFRGGA